MQKMTQNIKLHVKIGGNHIPDFRNSINAMRVDADGSILSASVSKTKSDMWPRELLQP